MKVKQGSIAAHILEALYILEDLTPALFKSPHVWARTAWGGNYNNYRSSAYRLKRMGLVSILGKDSKKYLQLTKKGKLEALFIQASWPKTEVWDGKWRLITFDIPEEAKDQRVLLRSLLKKNNFYKLQASVYISPHPLNRQAIAYLKETGFIRYIRILRVDEIDYDKDLRKKFDL